MYAKVALATEPAFLALALVRLSRWKRTTIVYRVRVRCTSSCSLVFSQARALVHRTYVHRTSYIVRVLCSTRLYLVALPCRSMYIVLVQSSATRMMCVRVHIYIYICTRTHRRARTQMHICTSYSYKVRCTMYIVQGTCT